MAITRWIIYFPAALKIPEQGAGVALGCLEEVHSEFSMRTIEAR
jgi:hypothetical protein